MSDQDLWGFDANPIPTQSTPAAILKDQANLFTERMSASGLFAQIDQRTFRDASKLAFSMDIIVPALSDYRLRVVSVSFSVREGLHNPRRSES